jgi:hypothetical protein
MRMRQEIRRSVMNAELFFTITFSLITNIYYREGFIFFPSRCMQSRCNRYMDPSLTGGREPSDQL